MRVSSPNTFGDLIRVTTFGESHGPAIGAVIDGLPPGIEISEEDIQKELDRRKPGQSSITTRRKESDKVHILSGFFEGKTTGAPLTLLIYNEDPKSHHYDNIRNIFRPGHADYTFFMKFGIRDHRGGGRASGRETATRVASGAIAKKILEKKGVKIYAYSIEIGGIPCYKIDNYENIEKNPVRCPDIETAEEMEKKILEVRKEGDSLGGIVQIEIHGVPPGLGDPVFGKLSARLASAIMSIGAVKGVEFGDGFKLARLKGSEANDNMEDGKFLTNHAGGLLGGISTGEPIVMRVVVKPTSSIAKQQKTLNTDFENVEIKVHGRHDPCIVPRAIPVMESMVALTILDAWVKQANLNPQWAEKWGCPFD
ncbi:MAG: chorismate synthase [Candidatus Hydrogenedentes bacterium]|nr:chorismate synthase [Candidatus Hydrogenedentota bacterium]